MEPGASQYLTTSPQILRVAAALPAAGALDATPLAVAVPGWRKCTLFCSYTRAAAGGSVRLVPEYSIPGAATTWYRPTIYDAGAFVAGADVVSNLQRESFLYTSTAAGAERFIYDFEMPSNVEYIRVGCCEVGTVATPGSMAIVAILSM